MATSPISTKLATSLLDQYGSECPVHPYVWALFAELEQRDDALELLLEVREERSVMGVVASLRSACRANLMVRGSYAMVTMGFEDMVANVLPLTTWGPVLRGIAALEVDGVLHAEIRAATTGVFPTLPQEGGVTGWSAEQVGRMRWLLSSIAAMGPSGTRRYTYVRRLLLAAARTAEADQSDRHPIAAVGHNREVRPAVMTSRITVNADAAERVYDLDCSNVTWAVVDTGIDARHKSFHDDHGVSRIVARYDVSKALRTLDQTGGISSDDTSVDLVRVLGDEAWKRFEALANIGPIKEGDDDENPLASPHGTHVAGVLGAREIELPRRRGKPPREDPSAAEGEPAGAAVTGVPGAVAAHGHDDTDEATAAADADCTTEETAELLSRIKGVASTIRLVDVRVFDDHGRAKEFDVLVALHFIRWLNDQPLIGPARIDGVNISLSVPVKADQYACGWTPVCQACDALVANGLPVVVAAGNSGYDVVTKQYSSISISDPGNADRVITVGATHRELPHLYGPIARSGRGPTADGRQKPDVLAPGFEILGPLPGGGVGSMTGTSMAAPHVSGVPPCSSAGSQTCAAAPKGSSGSSATHQPTSAGIATSKVTDSSMRCARCRSRRYDRSVS